MVEMLAGGLNIMVEAPPDLIAQFRDAPDFIVLERAGPHVWVSHPQNEGGAAPGSGHAVNRLGMVTLDWRTNGIPFWCDGKRPTGWNWSGLRSPVGRI
jgi:peptide/nickel transport system substrate-binding protein